MDIYRALKPHLDGLAQFQFVATNPLFWGALCVLCVLLAKFWEPKHAFSFCCITAMLLLATTKTEKIITAHALKAGEAFDPVIVRIFFVIILAFILIYYLFIK